MARTIPVSAGFHPLAVGPDGTVYVANSTGNTVSVIAPKGTAVDRTIKVGAGPAEIAVANDGTAFVTNQTAGTVSVIPAGADAVSKTIELVSDTGTSEQPHGIAAGPDGTVYVASIKSTTSPSSSPAPTPWLSGSTSRAGRRTWPSHRTAPCT